MAKMFVSQQKYDGMCDSIRKAMKYSSMTSEQKAAFDKELSAIMERKGVTIDPALNIGISSNEENPAETGSGASDTEDEMQNRDEINNGIPSYEDKKEDPSHDKEDGMEL